MVSLNPYFNGTCSKSYFGKLDEDSYVIVLILILMEHAQRAGREIAQEVDNLKGLNPYFNGTCSKRED